MAKGKKSTEIAAGQTNLGFEPCEPGDIVKSRSKEDISTLNKNLKEEGEEGVKPKLGKKKKFKGSDRIENDLFEEGTTGKRRSKKKKVKSNDPEAIELAPLGDSKPEDLEEEINVIIDKANIKKQKKRSAKAKPRSKSAAENANNDDIELRAGALQKKTLDADEEIELDRKKNQVLGVFVHYADCLKLDFFVLHPVVKAQWIILPLSWARKKCFNQFKLLGLITKIL